MSLVINVICHFLDCHSNSWVQVHTYSQVQSIIFTLYAGIQNGQIDFFLNVTLGKTFFKKK